MADPNQPEFRVQNLALASGLTDVRLDDRGGLLSALDRRRRMSDLQGSSTAIDRFREQSLEMVTGPQARAAFNIQAESDTLRDHYG